MFLYSLMLGAGLAVSSPWWLARMLTTSRYREGLRERLGLVPARTRLTVAGRRVVWVHAVSVGEVLAASQLIDELETALNAGIQAELWRVVISTTTQTGQKLARERFGVDRVFWFPLDFAWAVRAWMRALQPRMLVLMESELWPRLLAECSRRGVPVAVANARMSDRSFRRAVQLQRLWRRVLAKVWLFLAQSEETAERLHALGVEENRVRVTGNLKYDLRPRETETTAALRPLLDRRVLVVAGSLLAPEETILLERWAALSGQVPEAVLLLAPRHPERFPAVARQIAGEFTLYRATELRELRERGKGGGGVERLKAGAVVLLDTVGDLASVYRLADVAYVGGSLARKGGHNPLEPARFGVPVVMGSSFENFREMVTEMQAIRGIRIVHSGEELANSLLHLLRNRVEADELGQRGLQIFERRSGATRRTVEALVELVKVDANSPTAGVRP